MHGLPICRNQCIGTFGAGAEGPKMTEGPERDPFRTAPKTLLERLFVRFFQSSKGDVH